MVSTPGFLPIKTYLINNHDIVVPLGMIIMLVRDYRYARGYLAVHIYVHVYLLIF